MTKQKNSRKQNFTEFLKSGPFLCSIVVLTVFTFIWVVLPATGSNSPGDPEYDARIQRDHREYLEKSEQPGTGAFYSEKSPEEIYILHQQQCLEEYDLKPGMSKYTYCINGKRERSQALAAISRNRYKVRRNLP